MVCQQSFQNLQLASTLGEGLPTEPDPAVLTALGKGLPTEPYRKNRSKNCWRNSGMIWQADVS